jgi:hypothetical protein
MTETAFLQLFWRPSGKITAIWIIFQNISYLLCSLDLLTMKIYLRTPRLCSYHVQLFSYEYFVKNMAAILIFLLAAILEHRVWSDKKNCQNGILVENRLRMIKNHVIPTVEKKMQKYTTA